MQCLELDNEMRINLSRIQAISIIYLIFINHTISPYIHIQQPLTKDTSVKCQMKKSRFFDNDINL